MYSNLFAEVAYWEQRMECSFLEALQYIEANESDFPSEIRRELKLFLFVATEMNEETV